MSNINIYLTSLEPNIPQANMSQSIGGYASTTYLYPKTTLVNTVGLYSDSLILSDSSNFMGLSYLSINDEIMEVDTISSSNITVKNRALFGTNKMHINGDYVYGIDISNNIFNSRYNIKNEQYRCVALKNETGGTMKSVSIGIVKNSDSKGSKLEIAIEVPTHGLLSDLNASGGSRSTLVDSSFMGKYSDNFFVNSILYFPIDPYNTSLNVGQERKIISFDSSTGTFVFESSLPFAVDISDAYIIEPSPAHRLSTGIEDEFDNDNYFSTFYSSGYKSIDINNRSQESDLLNDDIIYIWLKKTIFGGYDAYTSNGFIFDVKYNL